MSNNGLSVVNDNSLAASGALTVDALLDQVEHIQKVMRSVMKLGEHYGTIPGCGDKLVLLKPGAEKLGFTFRLATEFKVTKTDLGNGHREYEVHCRLTSITTGAFIGEGVGSCSTMESKYRWRQNAAFEVTDLDIPPDAKEKKGLYRKQGFGMKKVDNEWKWVRYLGGSDRVENPDIADTYNTVLKIAKKRAHVDAILTATAASDIFTQDVEEDAPEEEAPPPRQQVKQQHQQGNGQQAKQQKQPEQAPIISKAQAEELAKLFAERDGDPSALLKAFGSYEGVPLANFEKIKKVLLERPLKQQQAQQTPATAEKQPEGDPEPEQQEEVAF